MAGFAPWHRCLLARFLQGAERLPPTPASVPALKTARPQASFAHLETLGGKHVCHPANEKYTWQAAPLDVTHVLLSHCALKTERGETATLPPLQGCYQSKLATPIGDGGQSAWRPLWPWVDGGGRSAWWPLSRFVDGGLRSAWSLSRFVDGGLTSAWPLSRFVDGGLRSAGQPLSPWIDGDANHSWFRKCCCGTRRAGARSGDRPQR